MVRGCIVILLAAGCSSTSHSPAAVPEPASAPPVQVPPPGRLLEVGGQPEGLAVDDASGTLAVAVRGPDGIVLIRLASLAIERRTALVGAARHLALAAAGGPLLVPAEQSDRLYQLSLPDGRVVAQTTVGRQPHDVTPAAGGRVFVGNEFADTVSIIADGAVVRTLAAPAQPGGLASSRDGTVIAVVGVRARRIAAYVAGEPLGSISAGAGPTHVAAGPANLFYVADTQGDAILVFAYHGRTIRQVGSVHVDNRPYGLAVDLHRGRLYATLTGSNELQSFRIDGPGLTPDRRWRTPRQPNSVAADPATGRVYVAGAADGDVQALQP
jgi:DNA-binding beta-propeller fold protein YncE